MSCPYNPFGQPACNIVAHPDRPGESFCASCSRRFQNSGSIIHASEPQMGFAEFLIRTLITIIVGAFILSGYPTIDIPINFFGSNQSRGQR